MKIKYKRDRINLGGLISRVLTRPEYIGDGRI